MMREFAYDDQAKEKTFRGEEFELNDDHEHGDDLLAVRGHLDVHQEVARDVLCPY